MNLNNYISNLSNDHKESLKLIYGLKNENEMNQMLSKEINDEKIISGGFSEVGNEKVSEMIQLSFRQTIPSEIFHQYKRIFYPIIIKLPEFQELSFDDRLEIRSFVQPLIANHLQIYLNFIFYSITNHTNDFDITLIRTIFDKRNPLSLSKSFVENIFVSNVSIPINHNIWNYNYPYLHPILNINFEMQLTWFVQVAQVFQIIRNGEDTYIQEDIDTLTYWTYHGDDVVQPILHTLEDISQSEHGETIQNMNDSLTYLWRRMTISRQFHKKDSLFLFRGASKTRLFSSRNIFKFEDKIFSSALAKGFIASSTSLLKANKFKRNLGQSGIVIILEIPHEIYSIDTFEGMRNFSQMSYPVMFSFGLGLQKDIFGNLVVTTISKLYKSESEILFPPGSLFSFENLFVDHSNEITYVHIKLFAQVKNNFELDFRNFIFNARSNLNIENEVSKIFYEQELIEELKKMGITSDEIKHEFQDSFN
jgi:hypothetical protein